jgi:uncharacterized protein (TIGR03437 family)
MFSSDRSLPRFLGVVISLTSATCLGQTYTTLTSFNGTNNDSPQAALVQGTDGNFYGTTKYGGGNGPKVLGSGSIFKMTPGGTITTLYMFPPSSPGSYPSGRLVQGVNGNFYGTTEFGGTLGLGTIFEATPAGAVTTLSNFSNYTHGAYPWVGLTLATDGNFYGTTVGGGANGDGSVFRMTPEGTVTIVSSFGSLPAQADGRSPYGDLVQGRDGNFYGTALGGPHNAGLIFKVTPAGVLTTLYGFSGADGQGPNAGLIQASDGNFYGTTEQGGAYKFGTVFKVTPAGVLTTLYSFGSTPTDGQLPAADLIQASDGNLYGTTEGGGAYFYGTVFQITQAGTLTILHNFGSTPTDGQIPYAGLIEGTDGNLYGTAGWGGANNGGTVYRLQLPGSTPYTCTNTNPPTITFVDSASSYGGYPYFASGSWLEIKGGNLADLSDPRLNSALNPGQWTASDFTGSNAPTSLDGISVNINGKPAYVWFLSPGQINVQAPEDSATGNVSITVTNCKATSFPFSFTRRSLAPGFLAPPNWTGDGNQYMLATFASDGAYVLDITTGPSGSINSRPAKPGDLIVAYGIGFGDVTPSILPGTIVGQSNTLVNPVTIYFGTAPATITYAGLAGGFVGLYEFYFTVPANLPDGDIQILVVQNGTTVPQTMYLAIHN